MGDAGIPWGWIICFCENLADDNNSGASVRIPGKLCRKISYVAVNYVVRLRDYAITLIFHLVDGLLFTTAAHEVRRAGVLTCGSCHLERSARPHPHRG